MNDSNVTWRSALSERLEIEHFEPLSSAVALELGAASVCGALRSHNSDHYLAIRLGRTEETLVSSLPEADLPPRFAEYGYAMAVADGRGDCGAGARASRLALSTLAHLLIRYGKWSLRVDPSTIDEIVERSEFLYRRTHDVLREARRSNPLLARMAASVTAMYIAGGDLFYVHVGHSTGFLFRDGHLVRLTADDAIDPAASMDAAGRSDRIGGPTDPRIDIEHVEVFPGDRLLLCTNGLTDAVSEHDIANVLALCRRPADECQQLIDLAGAARAADDLTVLVADYRLRR
ncbi:MAG TPA: SpoIIE family protein phosphatase [Vicinamibacterales bacterium]|nr:SpoIIE family protein phosphatase [Vicinamibacterales bacterium]